MNCSDLDWESRGARTLESDEEAHLVGCSACQMEHALGVGLRASGGEGPSPALDVRIRAQAHAALAKGPGHVGWIGVWLAASVGAVVLAGNTDLVMHLGLRPDLAVLPRPLTRVSCVLLLAAFALAGKAALGPGLVPRGRGLAVVIAGAAGASLLCFPGCHLGSGGGAPKCFMTLVAVSAGPLLAFFALVRRHSRAWLTGACAGLAAGALGEVAVSAHCSSHSLTHIVFGHLMAWAALAGVGAGLVVLLPARIWKPSKSPQP